MGQVDDQTLILCNLFPAFVLGNIKILLYETLPENTTEIRKIGNELVYNSTGLY